MVTIEHHAGRLIEIRQTGLVTMEEISANNAKMGGILGKIGRPVFVAADWRGIRILAPEVAEVLLGIMQTNMVDRTGVLLDSSAIIGLQLERIFRQVGSKNQIACRTAVQLESWFDAALSRAEKDALRRFLDAGTALVGTNV